MEPATIKSYWDKLKVVLPHAAKKGHFLDPVQVENYFEEITVSVPKKKEGQHFNVRLGYIFVNILFLKLVLSVLKIGSK